MEVVKKIYLRAWRGLLLLLSLGAIAYLLYFRLLGSLLPGYNAAEINTYASATNWHAITHNPVDAPYKLLVWLLAELTHHSAFATRAVAAGIGALAAILFFVIVRAWCSYRIAFVAAVMFATSAGLLHFARFGTGDILQMSVLALLGFTLWYRDQRNHRMFIGYLLVILFIALWYVPGMIWFELLGLIPLRATIQGQLRRTKTWNLVGMSAVFLACLAPLIWAGIGRPNVFLEVLGLPQNLHTLTNFAANLLHLLMGITIHSNGSAVLWVGHAPLLNGIEVIAGVLGIYYVFRESSKRRVFMLGSTLIGLVLAALGGEVTFACLVPALYLFIAIGLDRFLASWLTVFPRNPIARLAGIGVICTLVVFSVFYQMRTYFVAWPNAPATQKVFNQPAP